MTLSRIMCFEHNAGQVGQKNFAAAHQGRRPLAMDSGRNRMMQTNMSFGDSTLDSTILSSSCFPRTYAKYSSS